jgi:hypothetical protein
LPARFAISDAIALPTTSSKRCALPDTTRIALALPAREVSLYAGRIRLLWQQMRGPIADRFPAPPGRPNDIKAYLKRAQEVYVTDAYHSLSIECYRVLIERVRRGGWNLDNDEQDRSQCACGAGLLAGLSSRTEERR